MNITFYTVSKKLNSTKLPTGTGTTYDCIIKDNCSILAPVIKLDVGIVSSPIAFNYAYISDWGRYYFVSDWTFSNRLWTASFSIDVLASYRTPILNLTPYVLRSASSFNSSVMDNSYNTLASETVIGTNPSTTLTLTAPELTATTTLTGAWNQYLETGYFYVTIISGANHGYSTWVFDWTGYKSFITLVMNMTISISGLADDLAKTLVNPIKYVTEVKWCPFLMPGITLGYNNIYVAYKYSIYQDHCAVVSSYTYFTYSTTIPVPKHPEASRGYWTNCSPYARYTLYAKPFGTFTLNAIDFVNDSNLNLLAKIDIRSGDAQFIVRSPSNNATLVDTTTKFMVDIPIVQTSATEFTLAGMGLNAIGNAISNNVESTANAIGSGLAAFNKVANPVGYLLLDATYGIENIATPDTSTVSTVGSALSTIGSAISAYGSGITSTGGFTNITIFTSFIPYLEGIFLGIAPDDNDHIGKPLMAETKLSDLSGYTICKDGDFEMNCTTTEKSAIASYLTGGFFIE